ncbi:MAG: hypothetical protein ACK4SB_01920 [Belliella pelovolcani]
MKKGFIYIFLALLCFMSCNQDDKDPQFNILGYWNVSLVSAPMTNTVLSGDQIVFSERYIFNDDGTFIKFSTRNNRSLEPLTEPIQALGLYEMKDALDPSHVFELTLTFETNRGMAVNCGNDGVENLLLTKENRLVNNSWSACDGLHFVYQKNSSRF